MILRVVLNMEPLADTFLKARIEARHGGHLLGCGSAAEGENVCAKWWRGKRKWQRSEKLQQQISFEAQPAEARLWREREAGKQKKLVKNEGLLPVNERGKQEAEGMCVYCAF